MERLACSFVSYSIGSGQCRNEVMDLTAWLVSQEEFGDVLFEATSVSEFREFFGRGGTEMLVLRVEPIESVNR